MTQENIPGTQASVQVLLDSFHLQIEQSPQCLCSRRLVISPFTCWDREVSACHSCSHTATPWTTAESLQLAVTAAIPTSRQAGHAPGEVDLLSGRQKACYCKHSTSKRSSLNKGAVHREEHSNHCNIKYTIRLVKEREINLLLNLARIKALS